LRGVQLREISAVLAAADVVRLPSKGCMQRQREKVRAVVVCGPSEELVVDVGLGEVADGRRIRRAHGGVAELE
jgi:hypothetical protein